VDRSWGAVDRPGVCSAGRRGRRVSSEHLLRGVGEVEEAVEVSVLRVDLTHAGRHAGHAPLRYQQVESLGGLQVDLTPDQAEELSQTELEGNQELGFV